MTDLLFVILVTHSFILAYTFFVKTVYKIAAVNRDTNAATISRYSAAISQLFSANSGNASTDNSLVPRPTHVHAREPGNETNGVYTYVMVSTILLEQSPGNFPL